MLFLFDSYLPPSQGDRRKNEIYIDNLKQTFREVNKHDKIEGEDFTELVFFIFGLFGEK